ncbi:hypothetical protein DM01DRAFT_1080470 [Hesseltinella vesiculosa]|uniref:Uncharacterized protein n=1 Tax=Hesseltinella vesiculosa TaxID=101127 RepID=A0A1X2GDS2_9FUNG|nr:hypothetical protein DM01DRAFT_1080470 [Hesseltinella vesiculosa]
MIACDMHFKSVTGKFKGRIKEELELDDIFLFFPQFYSNFRSKIKVGMLLIEFIAAFTNKFHNEDSFVVDVCVAIVKEVANEDGENGLGSHMT